MVDFDQLGELVEREVRAKHWRALPKALMPLVQRFLNGAAVATNGDALDHPDWHVQRCRGGVLILHGPDLRLDLWLQDFDGLVRDTSDEWTIRVSQPPARAWARRFAPETPAQRRPRAAAGSHHPRAE